MRDFLRITSEVRSPRVLSPPIFNSLVVFDCAQSTFQPLVREKIEQLNLVTILLCFGDQFQRAPPALKGPLVDQTECSLFGPNQALPNNNGRRSVEIIVIQLDLAVTVLVFQRLEKLVLLRTLLAQEELSKPFWLNLKNKLSRPRVRLVWLLWSGKPINVVSVTRDLNEIV